MSSRSSRWFKLKVVSTILATLIAAAVAAYIRIERHREIIKVSGEITAKLQEASRQSAELRQKLQVLMADRTRMTEATELVKRIGILENQAPLTRLQRFGDRVSALPRQITEIEAAITRLSAEKAAGSLPELQAAFQRAAQLEEQISLRRSSLDDLLLTSRGIQTALLQRIDSETAIISKELNHFTITLFGYLQEREDHRKDLTRSAIRLGTLADLLYSAESVIKKMQRLVESHASVPALRERLAYIDPKDKLSLKNRHDRRERASLPKETRGPLAPEIQLLRQGFWRVKSHGLNVRSRPSTTGRVLYVIRKGQAVTVLNDDGYWWLIQSRAGQGWVGSKYLEKVSTFRTR